MDTGKFDDLTRAFGRGASRRSILKRLLGMGGAAVAGSALFDDSAEAARRPTPTPRPIRCPGDQIVVDGQCQCPDGTSMCGPACCNPDGVGADHSECCDNACCQGTCYGEELCCPYPREFCAVTGECCPEGWTCCPDYGCIAPGQCCTAVDCAEGQICLDNRACCTPSCAEGTCGDDGCGGLCNDGACSEGHGCGDDGLCHVCSVCAPVSETCGDQCYTICTADGVVCLSGGIAGVCFGGEVCAPGEYCTETCYGMVCLRPCASGEARLTEAEQPATDAIAG